MSAPRVHAATGGDSLNWFRRQGQEIFLADAIDSTSGATMSVGFAQYAAGAENAWRVNYDEVLVVTRGRFVVEGPDGAVEAGPGEVIYLMTGTTLTYRAISKSEVIYVSHPHWYEATRDSVDAWRLDDFVAASDNELDAGARGQAPDNPSGAGLAGTSP